MKLVGEIEFRCWSWVRIKTEIAGRRERREEIESKIESRVEKNRKRKKPRTKKGLESVN